MGSAWARACGSFVGDRSAVRREFTSVGAGDADTAAGEDDGLDWCGIVRWIDNGIGIDNGTGVRNWRSVDSGIDNGIGVNAGVRIWRSISVDVAITVSIGRDAGVGADDSCDWIGCDECGAGVRGWRGAGCGRDAGAWRRN